MDEVEEDPHDTTVSTSPSPQASLTKSLTFHHFVDKIESFSNNNTTTTTTTTTTTPKSLETSAISKSKPTTFSSSSSSLFSLSELNVWRLGSALWDRIFIPDLGDEPLTTEQMNYISDCLRKDRVSEWLKETVHAQVMSEIEQISGDSSSDIIKGVFSYLTGRLVGKAAMKALKGRNPRLAMLLGCIGGSSAIVSVPDTKGQSGASGHCVPGSGSTDLNIVRQIYNQIQIWKVQKVHIPSDYLRIYQLLGGDPEEWIDSIFKGLDWKRAFGLLFWYADGGKWSIKEVVDWYALSGGMKSIPRPLPDYVVSSSSSSSMTQKKTSSEGNGYHRDKIEVDEDNDNDEKSLKLTELIDLTFHMFKMFTDPEHFLENSLLPQMITSHRQDYRVSWLLWSILSQVKQVRQFKDTKISFQIQDKDDTNSMMMMTDRKPDSSAAALMESEDEQIIGLASGWSKTADYLTMTFINQLEYLGLWELGIFVSLFLGTRGGRESMIKELLSRWYPRKDRSGSCAIEILGEDYDIEEQSKEDEKVEKRGGRAGRGFRSKLKDRQRLDMNWLLTRRRKENDVEEDIDMNEYYDEHQSNIWKTLVYDFKIPAVWIHEAKVIMFVLFFGGYFCFYFLMR